MTNTYIDMGGVENVACAMVRHAKKDFIKGAKILYSNMHKIPTHDELLNDFTFKTLANDQNVRWMYDSWRFVKKDPYAMFGDVGEESIINSWKLEAIIDYYKDHYINGAVVIFSSGITDIFKLKNDDISQLINDRRVFDDFIKARDYINTLTDGKTYVKKWDEIAFNRIRERKRKRGQGRISIENTKFAQSNHATRLKNIEKAKELKKAGISSKAIAKELNVVLSTVNNYLRS